jgi:hypothetical protein
MCENRISPKPLGYYALDRDTDVSGVSDTGRVAYALDFGKGVLLVWDTQWATVDWRRDMATLEQIHGHGGLTRVTPLTGDEGADGRARADELLRAVHQQAAATFAIADVYLDEP